jgi:PKD repeat protein
MIVELDATITVMGTDGAGHDISKTITFDLPALLPGIDFTPPVAKIVTDPSPPSGNIPITVTFDASSSTDNRGIASYLWNFGDGTTSTSVVVSHTYNTPGSYTVTLTVTDYFNNQDIETVTVAAGDSAGPTAAISTIPVTPNVGTGVTITFDGTVSAVSGDCGCGTTIVSYKWDFGDGETDSGSIVNHAYDTAGIYTVTLTVTDSNGKSAVTSVTVTIS